MGRGLDPLVLPGEDRVAIGIPASLNADQRTDIEAAIGRLRPDVLTVPYVMLGGTDGRHAHRITDRVYRFAPFAMTREERLTLHARDERIRIDTWLDGCRWYADLIETSC